MLRRPKPIAAAAFGVFLLPVAVNAALYSTEGRPWGWHRADWSSAGLLRPPAEDPAARVLVLTGRTGGWKGIFAVHSWVVVKPENASRWTRYDVVGWGRPVRVNGWAADGRWFGDVPRILVDVRGPEAAALIPRIEAVIGSYPYSNPGDYRIWPGPNSNTFVATILRALPELNATLPPNAIGKDYRSGAVAGLTDSGTGIEASLFGLLGVKLGWVEGVEINLFCLVAGLDLRHPALKLPGFGRIGLNSATAVASPRRHGSD